MYSFFIYVYSLLVRFASLFNKKAALMCEGQSQTFDILSRKINPGEKYIWFHAASLGEFEQGRPIIEKIKAQKPEYKILLTFFSPSGYEVRKNYNLADVICYLPFDTPNNVRKFLDLAQPSMAIFIKYEFWANYLNTLKQRNIPTYIISAIFRPEQIFFKWYGMFYRNVLRCFNHLYVQDRESVKLLESVSVTNVTVTGDTRYDRVWDICQSAKNIPEIDSFVYDNKGNKIKTLIAGSSWPQDENIFIPYFNDCPDIKLIIAPHEIHASHLEMIESLLKRPYIRLSEAKGKNLSEYDCVIIDCFGLLSSIYRYGEIAYIGGGFGAGIHNTLEAAVYGIPVVFGKKYGKFKEAKDLIAVGGGFSISESSEFEKLMNRFISDEEFLLSSGKASLKLVESNLGVSEKIMHDIFIKE